MSPQFFAASWNPWNPWTPEVGGALLRLPLDSHHLARSLASRRALNRGGVGSGGRMYVDIVFFFFVMELVGFFFNLYIIIRLLWIIVDYDYYDYYDCYGLL